MTTKGFKYFVSEEQVKMKQKRKELKKSDLCNEIIR
ncbi:MAG: hypothetical protein KatS3mg035_0671 [Bacteroidia bacterium]|nr:MAG: hypothetical protein KatS3mg035_0671 [Bacteroidia bacterium]